MSICQLCELPIEDDQTVHSTEDCLGSALKEIRRLKVLEGFLAEMRDSLESWGAPFVLDYALSEVEKITMDAHFMRMVMAQLGEKPKAIRHKSDCQLHNAPAYKPEQCSCLQSGCGTPK